LAFQQQLPSHDAELSVKSAMIDLIYRLGEAEPLGRLRYRGSRL
jgi:hypothetical protein